MDSTASLHWSTRLLRAACLLLPFTWVTDQTVAAVWALWCAAGVLEFLRSRGSPPQDEALQSALRWLWVGAAASAGLVALSVFVHHDNLRFVRQELKPLMLFLAVAAWSRCRRVDPTTARLMDSGLMLGMLAAPVVALTIARDHLPGNAVPWATTIAAAVCVAMPRALLGTATPGWRLAYFAASAAALTAVALSQTRAALWVLPWLALLVLAVPRRASMKLVLATGLAACVVVWGLWAQPFDPGGQLRLGDAWREMERFRNHGDVETSIGARMALWGLAADRIAESPASALVGHGSAARLDEIRALAERASSPHLAGLTHFHSQYVNSLYDFGIAGLGAILAMMLGMAGLLRAKSANARVLHWQLAGLVWLQATGFVTNANWLHGHYVFTIALLVAICALPREADEAPADRPDPDTRSSAHPKVGGAR